MRRLIDLQKLEPSSNSQMTQSRGVTEISTTRRSALYPPTLPALMAISTHTLYVHFFSFSHRNRFTNALSHQNNNKDDIGS